MKNGKYFVEDIIKSFKWLNHKNHGFTELTAIHPKYKYGKENFDYNLKNGYLPKIWYIRSEKQLMAFIKKYHEDHICCYGVNPRPRIIKNEKGYLKSAKDLDIETVLSFYLDFDLDKATSLNLHGLEELVSEIEFYLKKEKIRKPVRAFTGNGYHLLFALPPIKVKDHPDIKNRINKFRDIINYEFSIQMKNEGIKLDSTMDLRRLAKIYGTRKPGSKLSRFYGNKRIENLELKEYLVSININEPKENKQPPKQKSDLPKSFLTLLEKDTYIKKLWNNEGKPNASDDSRTGYDFSLIKGCIKRGITDINDLFTILVLRPRGAFQKSCKNEQYVWRTIGNANYR